MQEHIFGILIPTMAMIYSAAFFLLWMRARTEFYILALVFAGTIRGAGVLAGDFVFNEGSVVGNLFCFACFATSVILLVWALCERCGKSSPVALHLVIAMTGTVLLGFASADGNYTAQLVISGTSLGLIAASGAHVLATAASRNILDRVLLWLTAIYAAQFFLRPIGAITFVPGLSTGNAGDSIYPAVVIVAMTLMTILHSTALIAAIMIDQFREKEQAAESDPLTGLKMRRVFEQETIDLLSTAGTRDVPVSLIMADIDHFKQVNDIWGHQAGDRALESFGALVRQKIRRSDVAGRIGGEEFAILVWNCPEEVAARLADRIRSSFAQMPHDFLNEDVRLTASFGVAQWCSGEGYGRLYARADRALYNAKGAGRNRVELAAVEPASVDGIELSSEEQADRRMSRAV